MRYFSILLLTTIHFMFIAENTSWAKGFGIVMDISGSVELKSHGTETTIELGTNISVGDELSLTNGSELALVSYGDCKEWTIKGPNSVKVSAAGLEGTGGSIVFLRQLPLCFRPSDMKDTQTPDMGGIRLRGMPYDPLESLRKEAEAGYVRNSTLMILTMFGIKNNKIDEVRIYFDMLKERKPNAAFIKKITKYFEK